MHAAEPARRPVDGLRLCYVSEVAEEAPEQHLPGYALALVLDLICQPFALASGLGGLPSLQLRLRLRQLRRTEDKTQVLVLPRLCSRSTWFRKAERSRYRGAKSRGRGDLVAKGCIRLWPLRTDSSMSCLTTLNGSCASVAAAAQPEDDGC